MSVEKVALWSLGLFLGSSIFSDIAIADTADEEEPAPEVEFLEYLGMWELTDEEWQLLDEPEAAIADERDEPAPQGEDSTETEDEG